MNSSGGDDSRKKWWLWSAQWSAHTANALGEYTDDERQSIEKEVADMGGVFDTEYFWIDLDRECGARG